LAKQNENESESEMFTHTVPAEIERIAVERNVALRICSSFIIFFKKSE